MADDASYTDDISALWGLDTEAGLSPAPPKVVNGVAGSGREPFLVNEHGNVNGLGPYAPTDQYDRHTEVARLTEALATPHADAVRRDDLDELRSGLEGTFTHQLTVALYELMSAFNARLSRAEDDISHRVEEAVDRQAVRLAASLEAHHLAATEMTEVVWREIDPIRQRFAGPIDGLARFQRELRHEVGRLSDLVSLHVQESAAAANAEAQRGERDDDRTERAAHDLGAISEVVRAMKVDLGALRSEVGELRAAVEGPERQERKSRWRGRNR
jgi:hypothetical protein